MDNDFLLSVILGVLVWSLILFQIIKGANGTTVRNKLLLQNQHLLALLCEKMGVNTEDIHKVLHGADHKKLKAQVNQAEV